MRGTLLHSINGIASEHWPMLHVESACAMSQLYQVICIQAGKSASAKDELREASGSKRSVFDLRAVTYEGGSCQACSRILNSIVPTG